MAETASAPFYFCGTDGLLNAKEANLNGNLVSQDGGPPHLAVNRSKFWPAGRKITVRFLNGSTDIQERVKFWAETWEDYANIDLKFLDADDTSNADIRVAFKYRGDLSTSSYVGTDARFVLEQTQPTMKFGQLDDLSTDADVSYTVLHEFGHAIGCVHEHQANPIEWDVDAVIDGCKDKYGWSPETTYNQILNQENVKDLTKTDFDSNSIMCYWFPPEWTVDKRSAPINRVLSDKDKSFINQMYPPRTRNDGKLDLVPGIRESADDVVWLNSTTVEFQPPYAMPPRVAVGLTQIDEGNNANIRIRLTAENITKDNFKLSMNTWANSSLGNASAAWLEFRPEERQFQGLYPLKKAKHAVTRTSTLPSC